MKVGNKIFSICPAYCKPIHANTRKIAKQLTNYALKNKLCIIIRKKNQQLVNRHCFLYKPQPNQSNNIQPLTNKTTINMQVKYTVNFNRQ